MGHYTGLLHLGKEAMNARDLPVYATARAARFLSNNAPWSHLVEQRQIHLRDLTPPGKVSLSPSLELEPILVPHRDESSDTLAFVAHGPNRRLFYCPDIDGWETWEYNLQEFLTQIDVALLDGCFFSPNDLPGRDLSQIPHPFVTDTAVRLVRPNGEVRLIHLNHTNPLLNDGPERLWLWQQGLTLGAFGQRWEL
jgi:pyrroloquinoline quinone biosynthesis protein B